MSNAMILKSLQDIDLNNLDNEQLINLSKNIAYNINLKQLREKINEVCISLAAVTDPCFGADIKFIALDNQKRLNLIYELLNNFNLLEARIKNIKRNKSNCIENNEFLFQFLIYTKDLINSVFKYGNFKIEEEKYNQQQLEEYTRKLLDK